MTTEEARKTHQDYIDGKADSFPYIDEEEKELIESIEGTSDEWKPASKEYIDDLKKRLKESNKTLNYKAKKGEFDNLKNELAKDGMKKEHIDKVENFVKTLLVVD